MFEIAIELDLAADERLLHFGNRVCDLNSTRASLSAVEGSSATPYAFLRVQDLKEDFVVNSCRW